MTGSEDRERKQARNRQRRLEQIRAWAEYVRTHPDDDWGEQVNAIVNAQLQSARHHEDDRPDPDAIRDSPLFDG